jgi:hypothetical protein
MVRKSRNNLGYGPWLFFVCEFSLNPWYSGWAGLAEESPWLERPRSFADLLSHADKIDPQDAELRQLYALLSAAIPEAIQGRQSGQL